MFGKYIRSGKTLMKDAIKEQFEMKKLFFSLNEYDPTNEDNKKTRDEVLKNAKNLFEIRNKIIRTFEDGTFALDENVSKNRLNN